MKKRVSCFLFILLHFTLQGCYFDASRKQSSASTNAEASNTAPQPMVLEGSGLSGTYSFLSSGLFSLTISNQADGFYPASSFSWIGLDSNLTIEQNNCPDPLPPLSSCNYVLKYVSAGDPTHPYNLTLSYVKSGTTLTTNHSLTFSGSFPGVVAVEKVFPLTGKNWNDYVKNTDPLLSAWSQQDITCSTLGVNEPTFASCIHGGEKLKVRTGQSSCAQLSLVEHLGVFQWTCKMLGSEAYFVTLGLKDEKGLRDLITPSGWKNNFVSVYKNSNIILESPATGPEALWWQNQILPLPDNSTVSMLTLNPDSDGIGKIYYLDSTRSARAYTLGPKASLVTLSGAALKPMDAVLTDLACAGSPTNTSCLINLNSLSDYVWIEADFEQTTSSAPSALISSEAPYSIEFVRLLNSNFRGKSNNASYLNALNNSIFKNLSFSGFSSGLYFKAFNDGNLVQKLMGRNTSIPLNFGSSMIRNTIREIYNFNGNRIYFYFTSRQIKIQGLSAFGVGGIVLDFLGIGSSLQSQIQSLLVVNSGGNSINPVISMQDVSGATFTNIAITNSTYALKFFNGTNNQNKFTGVLMLGNNTSDCTTDAENFGIINTTCADNYTDGNTNYTGSLSNAILRTARTGASSFVGRSISDDPVNTIDVSGLATFASITISQINAFVNAFRSFGKEGTNHIDSAMKGQCTAGSCRIYDWSLLNTDTVFRNVTGNGSAQNEAFLDGGNCPSAVSGNLTTTDLSILPQTYLNNAWEILLDGEGDEDGLCESNEACLYTPNFGAYQGHGDFWNNKCVFQNGIITGVTMYAYPSNGY